LPKFVVDQTRRIHVGSNSGRIDSCGIQQHDRDVVLNRVNTATDAAFQAAAIGVENDRLFAIRTNQDVEQILRNHRDSIVIVYGGMRDEVECGEKHTGTRCDRIAFQITDRH
jgi:hypothetical protein